METVKLFGRYVIPITTLKGQRDYYDYMNYWRSCIQNTNLRITPTEEDGKEYLTLKNEKPSLFGNLEERKRYRKLQAYENNYDWRPKKSGETHFIGLVSPTGEQFLPNFFEDVFTQFDAINNRIQFIPVSNGDGWALVSLGTAPVLVTEFRYNAIILERWDHCIFFVQDKKTMKWGALRAIWESTNALTRYKNSLVTIESLMPCIADDIYEDQLMTDCEPTLFFMTRIGDKIGILTDWGYSKIIYDQYETNDTGRSFRLISNDRKRARRADFYSPDGKDLYENNIRRMKRLAENESKLPVIMYIHGFRSGANGSKHQQLQEHFRGKYRVIAPEVDADPKKSLAKINEIIALEKPEIIVGTSLGGWMAVMCNSGEAQLVVINPATAPEATLAQWEGQELPYFCSRLDGVQTYTLTEEVLDKYKDYDFEAVVKEKAANIHALCSTGDELFSDSHIKILQPILPNKHLTVVDDFGHRCDSKGLTHLFEILDSIVRQ